MSDYNVNPDYSRNNDANRGYFGNEPSSSFEYNSPAYFGALTRETNEASLRNMAENNGGYSGSAPGWSIWFWIIPIGIVVGLFAVPRFVEMYRSDRERPLYIPHVGDLVSTHNCTPFWNKGDDPAKRRPRGSLAAVNVLRVTAEPKWWAQDIERFDSRLHSMWFLDAIVSDDHIAVADATGRVIIIRFGDSESLYGQQSPVNRLLVTPPTYHKCRL